jgi:hypothetical protein
MFRKHIQLRKLGNAFLAISLGSMFVAVSLTPAGAAPATNITISRTGSVVTIEADCTSTNPANEVPLDASDIIDLYSGDTVQISSKYTGGSNECKNWYIGFGNLGTHFSTFPETVWNANIPTRTLVVKDPAPIGLTSWIGYWGNTVAGRDYGIKVGFNIVAPPAPGTPGQPSATAGDGEATITISPPNSGGSPTSYTVTAAPDGATCIINSPSTSCTIRGLTNGIPYTFSSIATNDSGPSSASVSSSSVTPQAINSGGRGNYTPVAEIKLDPCKAVSAAENVTRKAKSFSGFAINSSVLTKAMKKEIRGFLRKHTEEVCVSVSGFTMGPRVLSTDAKLAKDRAKVVRAYIKSLRPEASFTKIKWSTEKRVGDNVRRAKITLRF